MEFLIFICANLAQQVSTLTGAQTNVFLPAATGIQLMLTQPLLLFVKQLIPLTAHSISKIHQIISACHYATLLISTVSITCA